MNTNMLNTTIALMQRELWEHRSFWLVPLGMAAFLLAGFLWLVSYSVPVESAIDHVIWELESAPDGKLADFNSVLASALALILLVFASFVTFFYFLDSLYAERRDRSILFWKSLPVSDAQTVASKWLSGLLLPTLAAIVLAAALHLVLTFIFGFVVIFWGGNGWDLVWSNYRPINGLWTAFSLYLITLLWYLPVLGWVMLASAWAKKAPFLWSVLPPLGLLIAESAFTDSDFFARLLVSRLAPPGLDHGFSVVQHQYEFDGGHLSLSAATSEGIGEAFSVLLSTPAFWGGLVFAAICTTGAIWLRRYRDES